uniref:Uncharacterized protein n=1 Tax=Anguilla anguilla TaxID=7936 RepID=A0A0E9XRW7_ANGAN
MRRGFRGVILLPPSPFNLPSVPKNVGLTGTGHAYIHYVTKSIWTPLGLWGFFFFTVWARPLSSSEG